MKVIGHKDIIELDISKTLFFEWAKEAFEFKQHALLPAKTSIKYYSGEGFMNTMPTILPFLGVYGVKVVTRNPLAIPNLRSNIMLFDLKTNDILAVMDGDYITAFRTGATAALSIETLAIKNYKTIGLIGLGNICRATLLVLLEFVKNRKIFLKLHLFQDTDNGLIEILKKFNNVIISTHKTIKEVVVDSDVVISCVTYAGEDLAKPEWFKKGCLLVPVHTRGFLGCDKVFDRVIIDDHEHCKGFKNYNDFNNCHELSDVLKNKQFGRANNQERIIAYNVGISILDISFAKHIYDLLSEKLADLNISDHKPQYWVR